jgi:UrcA family protein
MLKYLIPVAALLSALVPVAGMTQDIPANVHVAYRDLDLHTSDGVQAFDRRIEAAIEAVCPASFATGTARKRLLEHCLTVTRANVAAQRERVLAQAGRSNVMLADTIR